MRFAFADQEGPSFLARTDDRVVAVPDQRAELVAAQVCPNVLQWVHARANRAGLAAKRYSREHVICRQSGASLRRRRAARRGRPACIWVLISARCSFIASALAAGMMMAAPTPRAGQMAPNRSGEVMTIVSHHERARTRLAPRRRHGSPSGRHVLRPETRSRPACRRRSRATHPSARCRSFFKCLLCCWVFFWVDRTWL